MNSRVRISIVVAVVVVLGYPVAAWLIGFGIQSQLEQREKEFSDQFPYAVVVKRDYRRGIYSSTEELTYTLGGPFAKTLNALPSGQAGAAHSITFRNLIHHGPLPQLRGFALATMDTELVLPPRARQELTAALGGQSTLLHTRMGWFGTSTTHFASPSFQQQLSDGAVVNFQGMSGTVESTRDLESWSGTFNTAGGSFKNATTRAALADLSMGGAMQRAFDTLSVGHAFIKMKSLDIGQATAERHVLLQGLSLDSTSSVKGDYLDMNLVLGADSLQAAQFGASRLGYSFRLEHLYGPSLAGFTEDMRKIQSAAATATPSVEQMQATFKKYGVEILARAPVLEIPRIGFAMPAGELLLSAKVTAPGLKREDLDAAPAAMQMALVRHLNAVVDLRIDVALADKLLDSSGKRDTIAPQLETFERQGYLKRDGKVFTTHLTFENGQLHVNGQPFPPLPAAPQAPTPEPLPRH